jgi:PncC family amidohydrolase
MKTQKLVEILKDKKITIGSVESMTGGMFASAITDIEGASGVFKGGLITYNSEEKITLAHVDSKTIDEFGVISWEVASQMAYNGRNLLNVDYCLSVTGNAGPTIEKGSQEIGQIFIAIANKEFIWGFPLNLDGSREKIRRMTVEAMIDAMMSIVK